MEENLPQEEDTLKDKYLIFSIGKEEYGIEIKYVLEIIGIQVITEVPHVPNYIRGIINLRGKVIPVVDVRLRFEKEFKEYDDRTCIVVIDIKNMYIGIIVDRVSEVVNIKEQQISQPPELNKNSKNKYIQGVAKVEDGIKLLLDCNELFTDEEMKTIK